VEPQLPWARSQPQPQSGGILQSPDSGPIPPSHARAMGQHTEGMQAPSPPCTRGVPSGRPRPVARSGSELGFRRGAGGAGQRSWDPRERGQWQRCAPGSLGGERGRERERQRLGWAGAAQAGAPGAGLGLAQELALAEGGGHRDGVRGESGLRTRPT